MKVLQVLPALERGGVEKGTLEIARALVQAGHESWVISAGGQLVKQLEAEGSQHRTWRVGEKSLFTLLLVRKLRKWLAEQCFDIVHVRSRMPAWISWLALRKMPENNRPRLVSTVHGLHSVNPYSEIMTCGEQVIAVSKTGRDYILNNYPRTEPSNIQLIYRGIDPTLYHPEYQPSTQWLETWYQNYPDLKGKHILTLPGRITRLKGHLDFIDIIQSLHHQYPDIRGLIVGGADPKHDFYLLEIQSKINQLRLQDVVILTGDRSDLRDIMAISEAVLSLSKKPESFGRTVLESLSLGTPVYGYDIGGVGELLNALYPAGAADSAKVVTEKLIKFFSQPKQDLEQKSIKWPHDYTLDSMCKQTLALYKSLLHTP